MAARMNYVVGKFVRETEKAIQITSAYDVDLYTLETHEAKFWLPKSQVVLYREHLDKNGCRQVVYKVPLWLVRKNNIPTIPKKIIDSIKHDED